MAAVSGDQGTKNVQFSFPEDNGATDEAFVVVGTPEVQERTQVSSSDIAEAKRQIIDLLLSSKGEVYVGSFEELQLAFETVYQQCQNDPRMTFGAVGLIISTLVEQVPWETSIVKDVWFSKGFDQVGFADNIATTVMAISLTDQIYKPTKLEISTATQMVWKLLSEDEGLLTQVKRDCAARMAESESFEMAFVETRAGVPSLCEVYENSILPNLRNKVEAETLRVMEAPTFALPMMSYIVQQ